MASHSCSSFAAPARDECVYTSCYCEENVYKCCELIAGKCQSLSRTYAVFITNPAKTVAVWEQKKGNPVVWDYHVICVHNGYVYDLDTSLEPFPIRADAYFRQCFLSCPEQFSASFRVVPAAMFLAHFSSDRSHMKRDDGTWASPPPDYDCIRSSNADKNMNLSEYFISPDDLAASSGNAATRSVRGIVCADAIQALAILM